MPKTKRQRSLAPAAEEQLSYESFIGSVRLYHIGMDEVSAKLNREIFWASRGKSANATREIGTEYIATDVEDNHFNVLAKFALTIAVAGRKEPAIAIESQFFAHFHTRMRADESYASRFATSEAKIIFWPYFRQLVSDVTARMHIPPITIPLTLD